MAASVCRLFAKVAPSFACRSFLRSATTLTDNITISQARSRHFSDIHRKFSSAKPLPQKEKVTIHFMLADGEKQSVQAKLGENLLDVIIENDVDIDGFGACEGTLACSTCHLIFKSADYEKLPEKPSDEELDMLDLAYELQDTSRLGCQVIVSKDMEGWEIRVPEGVADAREP